MASGLSPDVVASAFNDLEKGFINQFDKFSPAFEHILDRQPSQLVKAKFYEWTLVHSGVGQFNTLMDPDQVIQAGRRQGSVRARAAVPVHIYAWEVPFDDYRVLNSAADLVKLIESYPERCLLEMQQVLNAQFVMGGRPELSGFCTLNGDATYNPRGLQLESGLLAFSAPSTQTGTVHGIDRGSVKGWNNKYEHISSFSADGRKLLRKAYYDASQEGGSDKVNGNIDLMLADPATFDNYVEDQDTRLVLNDTPKGDDPLAKSGRDGIPFLNATMYRENDIDLSGFTTANAQLGVCYALHTAQLQMLHQGADSSRETDGKFAMRGPMRPYDREIHRWEYVMAMNIMTKQLRNHAAITGGAQ